MPLFNIAGIAVSIFFIIFILSKKNHKRADFWLILINLLMIGFLTLVILTHQKITITRFFLQTQFPFYLFPVFLLFAIETLQKKVRPVWLVLFLPAFMSTTCIGADLYLIHDYNNQVLLNGVYNNPPLFYHLLYKGNQLFFMVVLVWLIKKLNAYKKEIKNNFSFTDPIDLHWLTNASWIFLVLTLISVTTFLLSNFKVFPIDAQASFSIISGCMVLVIFYLSLHGIRQYSITEYYGRQQYVDQVEEITSLKTEVVNSKDDSKEKYKTSSLTQGEQEVIYSMLLKLFENESIYRESKLQLQDVSDMLKVAPHNLSQTINSIAGKPFYDFVNDYRIKYLQKLLEDPGQKRFTILALGIESGFNSKASLNRVFKERTGLSPSAYQRRHLQK
jgi:AraC-like DNA-binding protein